MVSETEVDQLEVERAHLRRIQAVHGRHLESARRTAERSAAEAAEATEDGIRDLHDDDAEADAAIAAAMVRQFSDRAMHAHRRVTELEAMGQALAFGYTTDDEGDRLDVGRLSVIDGDETLLVDWRADAAVPFYRATPLERLEVARRRHLHYGDGSTAHVEALDGYSDEVFTLGALGSEVGLRGEAALLASVSAPTEAQMRSVVATIQAEQDAVIRAPSNKPLVVQGGPGTGKTVVALHRAAYLLYAQRASLSESGVLIVGPTTEFLSYIRGVLPSLGETGVVSVRVPKLFPGILLGLHDTPEVADLKGQAVMAELLANAVVDRRRRPKADLRIYYGSVRVVLGRSKLEEIFDRSSRHQTHNEGANAFAESIIEALQAAVYSPSFDNSEDAYDTFRASIDVKRFLLRHWPPLSAEQALNDLFGSTALLASAAEGTGLGSTQVVSLRRKRTSEMDLETIRWSEADVALLDELEDLLGGSGFNQIDERDVERDEADEFELAEASNDERADPGDTKANGDTRSSGDPVANREWRAEALRRRGPSDGVEESGLDELDEVGLEDPVFGRRIYYDSAVAPLDAPLDMEAGP